MGQCVTAELFFCHIFLEKVLLVTLRNAVH